jgi:hypothetical protein
LAEKNLPLTDALAYFANIDTIQYIQGMGVGIRITFTILCKGGLPLKKLFKFSL